MKLLKLSVSGLTILKPFVIDFYASSRVMTADTEVRQLSQSCNVSTETAMAFTGLNATGKTTVLRSIGLAVNLITGRELLGTLAIAPIVTLFGEDGVTIQVIYQDDGGLHLLKSHLISHVVENGSEAWPGLDRVCVIQDETIWNHPALHITKKALSDFDAFKQQSHTKCVTRKTQDSTILSALGQTRSIATIQQTNEQSGNKRNRTNAAVQASVVSVIDSDLGGVQTLLNATPQVTHVFDRSVDSIETRDDGMTIVHFSGDVPDRKTSGIGLNALLSVGTVRGIRIVRAAITALRNGGYLLVDEIENSLNKKLVEVIIDLFRSPVTNPNNAVIVFTTHYPELLDYLDRTDQIYFTRRQNGNRATVSKLADLGTRTDLLASTQFEANRFGGTAPKADDLMALRKYVVSRVRNQE